MLRFNKGNHLVWLSDVLEKLGKASEAGDFDVILDYENLSDNEADVVRFLNKVLNNYKRNIEYELMKYKLTSDALGVALWDMDVVNGDPVNPKNSFTWS